MDFALPDELTALQEEATELGREWAGRTPFPEDSWIVGHDAAFAKELAARGWIGMTWPRAYGGPGRPLLGRLALTPGEPAPPPPRAAPWVRAAHGRPPPLADRAGELRELMVERRLEARAWTREHGEDRPEIRDWAWPGTG